MTDQVIVLGAGRPHRGTVPSALRTDREGVPALHWLLDALGADLRTVVFIGGYGVEAVRKRYPDLRVVIPGAWERSGSAASLLEAPLVAGISATVVYSDVLVRSSLVDAVRDVQGEVVLAWDSAWRRRFAGRRREELSDREKVVVDGASVLRSGPAVPLDAASGEFVGLVRFAPQAVDRLLGERERLSEELHNRARLSELVDLLRARGVLVAGTDADGDWAEIDAPSDIARFVLGTKAETLGRLGRLVRASTVADQVTRTVAEWQDDPAGSVREVEARLGDRALIVRSSTTHEDAFSGSNAGGFTSVLGVRVGPGLVAAVGRVIESYRRSGIDVEVQQVLVQPIVEDVRFSGVALTRTLDHGAPWVVIEYAEGADTEAVTSGSSSTTRSLYLRRAAMSEAGVPTECGAQRELGLLSGLVRAVDEVERLLGHDALDVEFAVDRAGEVHLLQVRPMVTASGAPRRDDAFDAAIVEARATWDRHGTAPEHLPGGRGRTRLVLGVMPDWNPAEIIGTAPGRLAVDLYRRLITDDVWAVQRAQVGYRDVRPSPLLVDIAGRPYVDVRASFASFLPAGLDDGLAGRLLEAGLGRLVERPHLHDKVEFAVVPTCVDPDWARWTRALTADGFSRDEVEELRLALLGVTRKILSRVDSELDRSERSSEKAMALTRQLKDPLERAAVLIDVATESGTLPFAHLARAAFVAVSLLRGAHACGVLSDDGVEGFHAGIRTVSQELSSDASAVASGRLTWDGLVTRWGHLRPGTYELTSPRYDADPERFLRPLVGTAAGSADASLGARTSAAWRSERSDFLALVEDLDLGFRGDVLERTMRRAIEGRESAKLAFTRTLSDALEEIARGWDSRGLDRSTVSDAPLALLLPDADGRVADAARVRDAAAVGRERRALAAALPLAPLLTARADLDAFVLGDDLPNFVGTMPVIAPVIELTEEGTAPPSLSGAVVLIPRADPGFDWIFGHGIAGLVTLYGGANSHMAIRAAEHGLPAAIGVGEQRYRALRTAAELELDPRGRTLRAL